MHVCSSALAHKTSVIIRIIVTHWPALTWQSQSCVLRPSTWTKMCGIESLCSLRHEYWLKLTGLNKEKLYIALNYFHAAV